MLKFLLLGCIQGFTEFLPVSSSGHLVLAQHFLGIEDMELEVTVVFHLGTLAAMLFFFYEDILRVLRQKASLKLILIVTLITGVAGIAGKSLFERAFGTPWFVAVEICITGVILLLTRRFMESSRSTLFTSDAVVLGIAQAWSISPGISRSGATIAALLLKGVNREAAFKFSFLAAIPAIAGAALFEMKDIQGTHMMQDHGAALLLGFVASFVTGIMALKVLKRVMRQAKLHYFGYYCLVAGMTSLVLLAQGR
jgi:undecaprenyl-diphosphatase